MQPFAALCILVVNLVHSSLVFRLDLHGRKPR